jgi:hypothetical protein
MKRVYPVYDWRMKYNYRRDEFFYPTGISLLDKNKILSVFFACPAIA